MVIELTITLKDEERNYKQKFLIYDSVTLGDEYDPILKECVDEAIQNFQGEAEDIVVRAMMVIK